MRQSWEAFHHWLSGMPGDFIAVLLISTALFGIWVALFAPPEIKILLLAYWWFP